MSVYQKLIDFDDLITKVKSDPIIINDLDLTTKEAKDNLRRLTRSDYESDFIALIPTCNCGYYKGIYNINIKCPKCNSYVRNSIEDIEPKVWFRAPERVTALINPIVLMMLRNRFTKCNFSVVDYLINHYYNPGVRKPNSVLLLEGAGIQRGLNYFIENFDTIYEMLIGLADFAANTDTNRACDIFMKENRHKLFPKHLPFINRSLLVIERNSYGIYVDNFIIDMINVVESLIQLNSSTLNQKQLENRIAKNIIQMTDIYTKYIEDYLSPKEGQFRKHIFGSRTNYSFRAVITSLTDNIKMDEIHVPWGIGVTLLRHHLVSKLLNYGMDLNTIIDLINRSVSVYNPLIASKLDELIEESKYKGLYVIMQRNPSLLQGSCQRVKITKFKKDPNDNTISIPITIVRPFNADFDGDEHNVSFSVDNKLADLWEPLGIEYNVFRLDKPLSVHEDMFLTKQLAACTLNFLNR